MPPPCRGYVARGSAPRRAHWRLCCRTCCASGRSTSARRSAGRRPAQVRPAGQLAVQLPSHLSTLLDKSEAAQEAWTAARSGLAGHPVLWPICASNSPQPSITTSPRRPPACKAGLTVGGAWRTGWDSNPRYALTQTRFPSVRLQPLGHLSSAGRGIASPPPCVHHRQCTAARFGRDASLRLPYLKSGLSVQPGSMIRTCMRQTLMKQRLACAPPSNPI